MLSKIFTAVIFAQIGSFQSCFCQETLSKSGVRTDAPKQALVSILLLTGDALEADGGNGPVVHVFPVSILLLSGDTLEEERFPKNTRHMSRFQSCFCQDTLLKRQYLRQLQCQFPVSILLHSRYALEVRNAGVPCGSRQVSILLVLGYGIEGPSSYRPRRRNSCFNPTSLRT